MAWDAESQTDGARCVVGRGQGLGGWSPLPLLFAYLSPSQEPDFFLLTVLAHASRLTVEHSSAQDSDRMLSLSGCLHKVS